MRLLIVCLLALPALAGCYEDCFDCEDVPDNTTSYARGEGTAQDSDLDGIPDASESRIAENCVIHGRSCQSLGITPPSVGVRDYILVQYSRSGADQDWRLSDWVWTEFDREMKQRSIDYQVADLGMADDLDVEATWDDPANAGRFWITYMGFDTAEEESAGWNEYNHIMMQDLPEAGDETDREHRMTLLHEVYHSLLGDLEGNQSTCDDDEVGGPGHSNHQDSILYVDGDCESQANLSKFDLAPDEDVELASSSFENLQAMNDDSWWV